MRRSLHGQGMWQGLLWEKEKLNFDAFCGGEKKNCQEHSHFCNFWGFFLYMFSTEIGLLLVFVHSANFCEWARNVLVEGINICSLMLCWQWSKLINRVRKMERAEEKENKKNYNFLVYFSNSCPKGFYSHIVLVTVI